MLSSTSFPPPHGTSYLRIYGDFRSSSHAATRAYAGANATEDATSGADDQAQVLLRPHAAVGFNTEHARLRAQAPEALYPGSAAWVF